MEFGITFKGFVEAERARYLVRAAEYAGFSSTAGSTIPTSCGATATPPSRCAWSTPATMRFGPLVTNPDVRDWSVAASIFGSLVEAERWPVRARSRSRRQLNPRHGQEAGARSPESPSSLPCHQARWCAARK
jgi:hypothetical protein